MGSTVCVRCGETLIPHSYCNVCRDVLCFTCSSCSMITDERIHSYCSNACILNGNCNNNNNNKQQLLDELNYPPLVANSDYTNTYYYLQNQFNDKLKYSSIKLSASYWSNIFESYKLMNRYWTNVLNISNPNTSVA